MLSFDGGVKLQRWNVDGSMSDINRYCTTDVGASNAKITRCTTAAFEKGISGFE